MGRLVARSSAVTTSGMHKIRELETVMFTSSPMAVHESMDLLLSIKKKRGSYFYIFNQD